MSPFPCGQSLFFKKRPELALVQSLPIKIISSKINDGTLYEETRKHTAQLLNGKYFSFKNRILIHLNLFLLFIISVKLKLDTRYGTIKVKSWVTKDLLLDPFIWGQSSNIINIIKSAVNKSKVDNLFFRTDLGLTWDWPGTELGQIWYRSDLMSWVMINFCWLSPKHFDCYVDLC